MGLPPWTGATPPVASLFARMPQNLRHNDAIVSFSGLGFFTMNLPRLLPALKEAGIDNPIVCANVNKAAFRMSEGIDAYRAATQKHPARVIAMSVLASGAIPPREAIEWVVNEPYVTSILFGASSRSNIESTVRIIRELDEGK